MTDRHAELEAGLRQTQQRIMRACAQAGRDPAEVTLVVVTKTFPTSDVRMLHGLGVRDVGENRHPEARQKAAACADLDLRWHYIGQLQTNKARSVAAYADVVHSVDRPRLVTALATGVPTGKTLDCLVQVSLDSPSAQGRGGAGSQDVLSIAAAVGEHAQLRLRGVMAVAPLGVDPDEAFGRLADVSRSVRARWPDAGAISAGMSGDLEAAVRHGATHVRVGSAILGTRPAAG